MLTTPLLKTSPPSWAEPEVTNKPVHKDETDAAGPFTVGVAVNDRPAGRRGPGAARLVVYSSQYLANNLSIGYDAENLDLLMNAVSWLRGRPELEGIAPKTHVALTLTADPVVRARLVLVPTVMAVLLIVTFGLATYLSRRD